MPDISSNTGVSANVANLAPNLQSIAAEQAQRIAVPTGAASGAAGPVSTETDVTSRAQRVSTVSVSDAARQRLAAEQDNTSTTSAAPGANLAAGNALQQRIQDLLGERGNSATAATNSASSSNSAASAAPSPATNSAANLATSPVVSTAGQVPGSGSAEANAPASGLAASQQRSDGNEVSAAVVSTTRPTLSEQIAQRLEDQQSDQGNEASATSELTGNPQRTQRA